MAEGVGMAGDGWWSWNDVGWMVEWGWRGMDGGVGMAWGEWWSRDGMDAMNAGQTRKCMCVYLSEKHPGNPWCPDFCQVVSV